jgi:hypothetical protein
MSHEPTIEPSRDPDSTGPDATVIPAWRATDADPVGPRPAVVPRAGAAQVEVPAAGPPDRANKHPWSGRRPDEDLAGGDERPGPSA